MSKLQIYFHSNNSGYSNELAEEEIVKQKNWRGFYLSLDDSLYSVSAIEPYRHNQEVQYAIDENGFAIVDVDEFIVKDVSKETLVEIVPSLVKSGFLERLKPISKDEQDNLELDLVSEFEV